MTKSESEQANTDPFGALWSLMFAQEFYRLILPVLPRVDMTELMVVNHIAISSYLRKPTYASEIMEAHGLARSTVHDTLQKFVEMGLIVSHRDPIDGRRTAYHYNPDTVTSIAAWDTKLRDALRAVTKGYGNDECPACGRALPFRTGDRSGD